MPERTIQCVTIVAVFAICGAARTLADEAPPWIAEGTAGMVAADHPEASAIGVAVLRAGGSAFDAAIATSAALTVTRPESTGIGGGGFMVAYIAAEKRFIALDFREMAPEAATPERYAKLHAEIGDGPSASIYGGNAVGVPGLVAGWREVHKRLGTREWKSLLEPAAALAERGFTVDESCRDSIESALKDFKKYPAFDARFAALKRRIAPEGVAREVGTRWERRDIAATLRLLAERGPDAFYAEPIGSSIIRAVNGAGGEMTEDDLRRYRVIERTPLRFSTQRHIPRPEAEPPFEWITMPPPSSGGACLAQLALVDAWLEKTEMYLAVRAPAIPLSWRIEAMKHAFANRSRFLADPDFAPVDVSKMVDAAYAKDLADKIARKQHPATIDAYGLRPPDDRGTSHFSIVDRAGNVVAWTETINGGYGSFVVVEPHGVILNNQMDDFTTVEGEANLFGLVQSRANLVGPGKRPLSSMTPTIVMREGKPVLAIGGSGGPRIITSVFQVAITVLGRGPHVLGIATSERAMSEPRVHHQWQPDEVFFDRDPNEQWKLIITALREQGYKVSEKRRGASVQYISIDAKTLRRTGVCDPRKGGRPAAE
ncbi:MAG: gamma-glutamyltransferase [Planctomycetota bacterium]